jgi:hypothetical protein
LTAGRLGGADDEHFEAVADLDVALGGAGVGVDDKVGDLAEGEVGALVEADGLGRVRVRRVRDDVLAHDLAQGWGCLGRKDRTTDLVVEEGLDKGLGRPGTAAGLALVAADRIEGVDGARPVPVDAAENDTALWMSLPELSRNKDALGVEREEALAVKDGVDQAGDGRQVGVLLVRVEVPLSSPSDVALPG